MKAVIVLLVIAVAVLGVVVYRQGQELKHQPTALKGEPAHVSLELQGQCAKQAEIEFKREGYTQTVFDYFENHYNAGMGKCFITVHHNAYENGSSTVSLLLVDAYEGKVYGTFTLITGPKGNPYRACYVVQTSGGEKKCQSQDEFDELAKAYMD